MRYGGPPGPVTRLAGLRAADHARGVREIVIAAFILALLGATSAAIMSPWESVFDVASWITLAGVVVGVPSGVVYHVGLYRALAPRGELPAGWYWQPLSFNDRLLEAERPWVLGWCYFGGLGFFVICFGLLLLVTAVVSAIALGV